MDDLNNLLQRAKDETSPQARASLWGECILFVLSLEDIREGLTFDEIRTMSDQDANHLAKHMQAVFEMRSSWRDGIPDSETNKGVISSDHHTALQHAIPIKSGHAQSRGPVMSTRKEWPKNVVDRILTQCHHRCCICPEHRRVAHIHHIDEDHSNSVEDNAVGLCGECHSDVHTISTMRRHITEDQIRKYKSEWAAKCKDVDWFLRSNINSFRSVYYLNVHRLDSLYRELRSRSFLGDVPHQYPVQEGRYNTLWSNQKNALDWIKLAENRSFFEERLFEIIPQLTIHDINLFELGAMFPEDRVGQLVGYSCQFIGQDIPDQSELVESNGEIGGPYPTMRRQLTDPATESVIETCLMIDPNYMYADSSFLAFSEDGIWNGFGRIVKVRGAVGSNDGHLLRKQIVVSPICIGTRADHAKTSRIGANATDADQQHRQLIGDN